MTTEDVVREYLEDVVREDLEDIVREDLEDVVREDLEDVVREDLVDVVCEDLEDVVREDLEDVVREDLEDVVREDMHEALLKEMDLIDDFVQDMRKHRIELSVTVKGTPSILSEVRSAISALKGKFTSASNRKSQRSCQELYQQTKENCVTASSIDKADEVDKSTKEEEPDDKIKKEKSEKNEENEKNIEKANEGDKPTKDEEQEYIIKNKEFCKSEKQSNKEMVVDNPKMERVVKRTIILRLARKNGKLVCSVKDEESEQDSNQPDQAKNMVMSSASSGTRISLDLTLEDIGENDNKLSLLEDRNMANFLHDFLCDIRNQVQNIFDDDRILVEHEESVIHELSSLKVSDKMLHQDNPKDP